MGITSSVLLNFSVCLTLSAFLFCLLQIQAPGGHELSCDFWELVGLAPAGGADNLINEESDVDVQLNNRHMMIRGENMSKILKARSMITRCFRDHFFDRGYCEVSACFRPPFLASGAWCHLEVMATAGLSAPSPLHR